MDKIMESLIERLINSKVTFGLREGDIDYIEDELKRYGSREINAKYVKYIWEKLGAELNWDPLILVLTYFEYLDKKELIKQFE